MKKLLLILLCLPMIGLSQVEYHRDETVTPTNSILTYFKSSMEVFTGDIIYDTLKNGQRRYECQYRNGKKHGLKREWYENGQLREQHEYEDGINLTRTEWHDNGNMKDLYKENKRTRWYKNSNLKEESSGTDKFCWALSGDLITEEKWIDGKKDGLSKSYFICSYKCKRRGHTGERDYDRRDDKIFNRIYTFHLTPLWKQLRTKLIKTEKNYSHGVLVGIQKTWRVGELDTIDAQKGNILRINSHTAGNARELEGRTAENVSEDQESTILNKETPEYRHYLYQEDNYGETGVLLWSKKYWVNGQKAEVHYSKEYNGVVSDTSFNKDGSILLLGSNKTVEPVANETTELNTDKEDDNSNPYLLYILIAIILIITFFFLKNKFLK